MSTIEQIIQQVSNIEQMLLCGTDIDDRERLLLYREQIDRLREAARLGARFEAEDHNNQASWQRLSQHRDELRATVTMLQGQLGAKDELQAEVEGLNSLVETLRAEIRELMVYRAFYVTKRRLAELEDEAARLTQELDYTIEPEIERLENGR